MPLVYHPKYSYPFDSKHRFVMSKFERLYDYCCNAGLVASNEHQPSAARIDELTLCHASRYLNDLTHNTLAPKALRRIGLPWSEALIERTLISPNGTLYAAELAIEFGVGVHLAGGTHHAHYDFGSGYCLLNDLAFVSRTLVARGQVQRVLIFDCDVHQGDGTAAILQEDEQIFCCSVHCEKNFPFRKQESDLDVGLSVGMRDMEYLHIVEQTLVRLLEHFQPDIVLYDAGVDVWKGDALGNLNISLEGIRARDDLVLEHCLDRAIPVATVIGGGYDRDHDALARRHGIIVHAAQDAFARFA
ncbi:MAG: histone deacetylase [Oleiphilaceae bacterium]|nr:histone deacetylase [Oleiphilaceae bacterium]